MSRGSCAGFFALVTWQVLCITVGQAAVGTQAAVGRQLYCKVEGSFAENHTGHAVIILIVFDI